MIHKNSLFTLAHHPNWEFYLPHTPAWYIIYTTPRAEKRVAERLEEMGIEVFLPLHKTPRRWSDRIKLVEVPLFPSYVFINTRKDKLYDILKTPGVARFVYFEGEPATLNQKEINAIREFLSFAEGKHTKIELQDEVKIATGPLVNKEGKVLKITKNYVLLRVNTLGYTVQVDLNTIIKK